MIKWRGGLKGTGEDDKASGLQSKWWRRQQQKSVQRLDAADKAKIGPDKTTRKEENSC